MNDNEKQQRLFAELVVMFHSATMHQLGKIKSPVTGKIERDLAGAQESIDILDMLKQKTNGNLSENESRLLTTVIQELKLNYVDELNRKSGEEQKAPAQGDAAASPEGQTPE